MINDEYLIDVAKALNGEIITDVDYIGFGATSITITPTMTDLSGEYSPRASIIKSRTSNAINVYGTRSGTSVLSSTGDYLNSSALFLALTGGIPRVIVDLPNLLQTTNFDIETNWNITISRR
jgi:hypothetical protein